MCDKIFVSLSFRNVKKLSQCHGIQHFSGSQNASVSSLWDVKKTSASFIAFNTLINLIYPFILIVVVFCSVVIDYDFVILN